MENFWESLLGSATAGAAGGAAVSLVAGYWLNRRLARFNNELQQKLAKVDRLHQIQAGKIPELFTRVVEIERSVELWFTSRLSLCIADGDARALREKKSNDIHQGLMDSREELRRYVSQNRLYFSNTIATILDEFDTALMRVTMDIAQITPSDSEEERRKKYVPVWDGQQQLRATLSKIEERFKEVLGLIEPSSVMGG